MTTLLRYTGLSPQRVSRDAKYSVSAGGSITLEYRESTRVRYLLSTEDHPDLADMVNDVKVAWQGARGGAFYINEFKFVLVPDGGGGPCFYAGQWDDTLVFRDGSLEVSPHAPEDLQPGDIWPGPHVGIPYVLNASLTDIRYDISEGRRTETFFLSDTNDSSAVRELTQRLGHHKRSAGGRIFINEAYEFFAPVREGDQWIYRYLGPLDLEKDPWFLPPEGFGE